MSEFIVVQSETNAKPPMASRKEIWWMRTRLN